MILYDNKLILMLFSLKSNSFKKDILLIIIASYNTICAVFLLKCFITRYLILLNSLLFQTDSAYTRNYIIKNL